MFNRLQSSGSPICLAVLVAIVLKRDSGRRQNPGARTHPGSGRRAFGSRTATSSKSSAASLRSDSWAIWVKVNQSL